MMNNANQVRSSLEKVCERGELAVETARTSRIKQYILELLQVLKKEDSQECFKSFSEALISTMQSVLHVSKPTTPAQLREIIWIEFADVRANKLPKYWKELCEALGCPHIMTEPLVMQLTNQQVFEEMLTSMFKTHIVKEQPADNTPTELTVDEDNVLRYACGYVARKLHQKYLKQHGEKYAMFVECLTRMRANFIEDSVPHQVTSFMEYTSQWVKIINRGGLYEVNDESFLLFKEIERVMQVRLRTHLEQGATTSSTVQLSGREEIVGVVKRDVNVLFYWDIISYSIQDDESKAELLTAIVSLWLTIRGYSITSQWMEQYKHLTCMNNKKKGLRKELKKS